ncbi:MAG: hypothetical protein HUU26_03025 [Gemmatimonadaceae bacterium]|nr:hypothetical protein [Gemmatimonadaceae bacterium]
MRRSALALGALTLILAATTATAQDKPNFSGTWTLVVDPNAAPPAGGGRGGRGGGRGLGAGATLTQDDKTLTIVRTTQMGEIRTVYNLDGSDSKNTVTMGGNSMEQVSKAVWDGNKLVVTTNQMMGENAVTITQTFMLDASGQLVVSVTAPGRGGGEPVTTTQTYKKG